MSNPNNFPSFHIPEAGNEVAGAYYLLAMGGLGVRSVGESGKLTLHADHIRLLAFSKCAAKHLNQRHAPKAYSQNRTSEFRDHRVQVTNAIAMKRAATDDQPATHVGKEGVAAVAAIIRNSFQLQPLTNVVVVGNVVGCIVYYTEHRVTMRA